MKTTPLAVISPALELKVSRFVFGVLDICGPSKNYEGNPLDGMYTTDDFGNLVKVPAAKLLVLF